MTCTVAFSHLGLAYRDRILAQDIDMELPAGKLICLTGANGTGKSTLLRTIAGLQKPAFGDVRIGQQSVRQASKSGMARLVSVVLTGRIDVQGMTVEELIGLGRTPYTGFWGRLNEADKAIVERSMALTATANLRHRKVETLSDGEQQKVMTAKALAQETPVMLLDEPTAFLDYPSKQALMELLRTLAHAENKTIIMASHDLDLARRIADLTLVMAKGRLEIKAL